MIIPKKTDGNFRVLFPGKALEFTGERMTTAIDGQIEFEHFHRYCLARDLCLGLDVLDVASGEGYGSAILAGVARSVTGVEIDVTSVRHAEESYRLDNLRFLQGNALDLPLEDASVDVVVSFETLEHVREHESFVSEVRRVLRPGGTFIVSSPDRATYSARGEHFNEFHLLELTKAEFAALLSAHFANVTVLLQRPVLGSVIAASDGGGLRSYERRGPEHVEASGGLARAPYLIGVASDAHLPQVGSSAYVDRRGVDEVLQGFGRASIIERERDEARARAAHYKQERDAAEALAATHAAARAEVMQQLEESDTKLAAMTRSQNSWRGVLKILRRRIRGKRN